jgi:sirohydrochlorin ferrochelatase
MYPVLLIIGHGSRDSRHAATVARLTNRVRALRPDLRVEHGFLDFDTPDVAGKLRELEAGGARDVIAVPLLLARAYHAKKDIPALLREAPSSLRIRQSGVLGPDPLLQQALERRITEVDVPDRSTTGLVIAAAGSSDPEAVTGIKAIVRNCRASGWRAVQPAFATAFSETSGVLSPEDAIRALRMTGIERVVVARYMISPGRLSDQIARGAKDADVVTAELGNAPEVASLLLTRYCETLHDAAGEASGTAADFRRVADHGCAVCTAPVGRR